MIEKLNNFRSKKLTQAAKDQACQNCGAEDGTIVCAHSNLYEDGKGKGMKADDLMTAHLCVRCHDWYDQRKTTQDPSGGFNGETIYENDDPHQEMWDRAFKRTIRHLGQTGVLKVA
jgi:hypothetical protein